MKRLWFNLRKGNFLRFAAAVGAAIGTAGAAFPSEPPVSVMIVGLVHFANPGKDLHDVQVDDVLTAKRQEEIQSAVDQLARFRPTQVMIEASPGSVDTRYAKYLSGNLGSSRNETVQLGFRLARQAGLKHVAGIDVLTDFPYEAVTAFASAHGQGAVLEKANADMDIQIRAITGVLQTGSIGAMLRYVNDPAFVAGFQAFYRAMLEIGQGPDQPGVELLTAWHRRNFLISANLIQAAKPGDRIVVFYGLGHAFLLRQCIAETPGFQLVEPNEYLTR